MMQASKRVVLVGDHLKLKEKRDFPALIEILQYAYPHVKRVLSSWEPEDGGQSLGRKDRARYNG